MANKYVKQEKYRVLLLVELVHVLSWSVTLPKMINETKDSILDETDSIILDKIFTQFSWVYFLHKTKYDKQLYCCLYY